MSYLTVLPLADMKTYLRVDITEDDASISSMIEAALSYIEDRTNFIVYQRNIIYDLNNQREARVYDFPYNAVVTPADSDEYKEIQRAGYVKIDVYDGDAETVTVDVGYANAADVPKWIIEAAKQIVKTWYYDQNKQVETAMLPQSLEQVLNLKRRFVI